MLNEALKLALLAMFFLAAHILSFLLATYILDLNRKPKKIFEIATLVGKMLISISTVVIGMSVFHFEGILVAAAAFFALMLFIFWLLVVHKQKAIEC